MATAPPFAISGPAGVRLWAGRQPAGGLLHGAAALEGVGAGGGLGVAAPPPPPPPPTGTLVQYITHDGDAVGNVPTSSAPNGYWWNTVLEQPWQNVGGDWLDSAQAAQGSAPFASTAAVATVGQRLTSNVTTLVQRWRANGLNRGFFLRQRANAFPVSFRGRTDATPADRPVLTVVTTTNTFNLTARCNASWAADFNTTSRALEFDTSSGYNAIVQFDLSSVTGTVTSASLAFTVKSLVQTGAILDVFEANPPTLFDPADVTSPALGIGATGNFAALESHPATLIATDFAVGKPLVYETFSSNPTDYIENEVSRTADGSRGTTYLRAYIAAGELGALNIKLPIVDSLTAGGVTNPAKRRDSAHGHVRFTMESTFAGFADRVKIPAMGAQLGYWNTSGQGYWDPVTGNGGVPGTGLKVIGTGGRVEYEGHSSRLVTGYRCSDTSAYSDYVRLATYIYHLDQVGGFPTEDVLPGIVLRRDVAYDFDHYLQLNTMSGAQDGLGNYATANADGIYRLWINGYQVLNRTNYRWRRHAEICVQGLWLDVYHGGTNPSDRDMYFRVNEAAVTTAYVGPLNTAPLPAWVPPPGEVAVLRTSTGQLSNTFGSVVSPLYDKFYSAKIVNDYGGGVLNPHWGLRGIAIFWGGGHAATNDNSAIGLAFNETGGTFIRLTTPTDLAGAGTGPDARLLNSLMNDGTTPTIDSRMGSEPHAEYWDGQPASPHTYGTLCVLGPADGGAAKGTLIKVVHGAGAVCGFFSAEAAHKIDFPTDNGAAGSYTWQRITNNRGRYVSHTVNDATFVAPVWEVLVPSQRRVYHEANYLGAPRWFDLDTEAYVIGTGAARAPCDEGVNGHVMLPIPERNLVVYLDRVGGIMRPQYLDTTQSNPSWTVAGALATTLTITADWCTACWCPDNQRIIVGDISGDAAACYEIEIPATLGNPWPVARAPFPSGQSIAWGPGRSYGKWSWNPRIKAIPYFPTADPDGLSDTVFVYRPRGT